MSRYLLQYVVPLLVLVLVVYLGRQLSRGREETSETEHDRSVVLLIFIFGAAVALGLGYLFYQYLET